MRVFEEFHDDSLTGRCCSCLRVLKHVATKGAWLPIFENVNGGAFATPCFYYE